MLWVGDQDMNQVRPPVWPLAKTGATADVFKAIPFGTDQRGRPVTLTLMYANMLIGAMPGACQDLRAQVPLLAAALDPTAQLRVFELKGTGDLDFAEKVAHHYGSGPDDVTIGECLASLREVYKDLERRAKTLAGLPKDVRPENKVTPQLAASTTYGLGPLVFVVDECQELFSHPEYGKEACRTGHRDHQAWPRPRRHPAARHPAPGQGLIADRHLGERGHPVLPARHGPTRKRHDPRHLDVQERDPSHHLHQARPRHRLPRREADEPQIARGYYLDGPTADRIADRARTARKATGTLTGYAVRGHHTRRGRFVAAGRRGRRSAARRGQGVVRDRRDPPRRTTPRDLRRMGRPRPDRQGQAPGRRTQPHGIATGQIWGQDQTGKGGNRRGITAADILDALNDHGDAAR